MRTVLSRICYLIVPAMAVAVALWATEACRAADAPVATITVQVDKPSAAISPILNGVFFEDLICQRCTHVIWFARA